MRAKRVDTIHSSMADSHTDELFNDNRYYSIREITSKMGHYSTYWKHRLMELEELGYVKIKKRRKYKYTYYKGEGLNLYFKDNNNNNKYGPIPKEFSGLVEMCIKIARKARGESKKIWAATAIYAYYAIKNDMDQKERKN